MSGRKLSSLGLQEVALKLAAYGPGAYAVLREMVLYFFCFVFMSIYLLRTQTRVLMSEFKDINGKHHISLTLSVRCLELG